MTEEELNEICVNLFNSLEGIESDKALSIAHKIYVNVLAQHYKERVERMIQDVNFNFFLFFKDYYEITKTDSQTSEADCTPVE